MYRQEVSIPQRDFGEFQRICYGRGREAFHVSIPQRDFGEFQPSSMRANIAKTSVSIPQRDFGEFQLKFERIPAQRDEFQSLKGILVNFNLSTGGNPF
ncbi:Epoxyqueuosine (oQ) reductase QueG [Geitlerinema sp. FC II]|nr:Epoxyqueuosine (oQ) reductase QueG [Geitlerinema sp. FC II]